MTAWVLVGVGTPRPLAPVHRSQRTIPKVLWASRKGPRQHRLGAAIESGPGHDLICLEVLAFCEAVLPNRLTCRTVSGCCDVGLLPRLRGMAAISMVIGFVSLRHVDIQAAQGLSAVATRCCCIYKNRGLKGDGQCWLSVRLLCRVVLGTAALSIGSRPKFQTSKAVLLYGGSP